MNLQFLIKIKIRTVTDTTCIGIYMQMMRGNFGTYAKTVKAI